MRNNQTLLLVLGLVVVVLVSAYVIGGGQKEQTFSRSPQPGEIRDECSWWNPFDWFGNCNDDTGKEKDPRPDEGSDKDKNDGGGISGEGCQVIEGTKDPDTGLPQCGGSCPEGKTCTNTVSRGCSCM